MNNKIHLLCKEEKTELTFFFLPAAGLRNNNGAFNNVGTNGNYWSATINGTNAYNLNFNSTGSNVNNNNRSNGMSVRCLEHLMRLSVRCVVLRLCEWCGPVSLLFFLLWVHFWKN